MKNTKMQQKDYNDYLERVCFICGTGHRQFASFIRVSNYKTEDSKAIFDRIMVCHNCINRRKTSEKWGDTYFYKILDERNALATQVQELKKIIKHKK